MFKCAFRKQATILANIDLIFIIPLYKTSAFPAGHFYMYTLKLKQYKIGKPNNERNGYKRQNGGYRHEL